MIRLLVKQIAF